jgi:integrase/recombinase XerC
MVMSDELAIRSEVSVPRLSGSDVLDAFLSGRNTNTLEAYVFDLRDFAGFVGAASPAAAVDGLLAMGHGNANRVVLGYRAHLTDRKLATATIARRIAALRSMVKLARQIGRVEWSLDVESPKVTKYRDTSGPGLEGWFKLRDKGKELAATTDQGKRDVALLHLMHDSCLRRGECVNLDLVDVDLERGQVAIVGKGKTEREWLTVSTQAKDALVQWIAARGDEPGPLFIRLDPGRNVADLERITGDSVNRIVSKLGAKSGLKRKARAHGLRHQGITRALDLTNGNIRMVQGLSRHADPRTLMKYDDSRRDDAGTLAQMLGNDSK